MRKLIVPVILIIFLLVVGGWYAFSKQSGTELDVLVAPSGAALKLDGKGIKSGTLKVKPGKHQLSATKAGFAAQNKTINVGTQTQFVGIVLQPNTAATTNWYVDHPEEFSVVQTINNRNFDQTGAQLTSDNPILKKLPHIGPALSYRIDYGLPSEASKTGQPGIYIRFHTQQDKQAALQWIKDQGTDPNKLDLIYIQGNF